MSVNKTDFTVHQLDIYPIDSYIHLVNNQGLISQLCLNLIIVFNIYL